MARILIVGAGATGGVYGEKLVEAGRDVTFLVRERRFEEISAEGIRVRRKSGTTSYPAKAIVTPEPGDVYDLILVTVKAPALPSVIENLKNAVGPNTIIIPLLNGMAHNAMFEDAFPGCVRGGIMRIMATLDPDNTVVQLTNLCELIVGGVHGRKLPDDVAAALDVPGIRLIVREDVTGSLWEKWAFIAAAGVTTILFRGNIGDIIAAGGHDMILDAVAECEAVAAASGYPVSEATHEQTVNMLTEPHSTFTSSLYRDLMNGNAQESEHLLGDMALRAQLLAVPAPLLNATVLQIRTQQLG